MNHVRSLLSATLSAISLVCVSGSAMAGPDVYGYGAGTLSDSVGNVQTLSPTTPLLPATAGSLSITVDDGSDYPVGTLILLHQTVVAGYSPVFSGPTGIDVTSNQVGHYELARVVGRSGGTLELDAPLEEAYTAGAQVVRVEEFSDLTVVTAGTLHGEPFDGASGGILVVFVDGDLVVDGTFDMTGRGFRGGDADPVGGYISGCNDGNDHPNAAFRGGGAGGEGTTGVGSLANGGGGANCGNGGGGGGGSWGGGGRGGFDHDSNPKGGWGGGFARPAWQDHFVLGGGGGSGDDNSGATDGEGADGGGLIWVRARSISGSGDFFAAGLDALDNVDDGAGGGGGGGTVILQSLAAPDCDTIDVRGGDGGSTQDVGGSGLNGPGGGGAGGRIVLEGTGSCTTQVQRGDRGTAFDPEGASEGAHGSSNGGDGDVRIESPEWEDVDGDGSLAGPNGGPDCDDSEPTVFPGAMEVCDGLDNDCDGQTDEGLATPDWYLDDDQDGFGDSSVVTSYCAQPTGYVADDGDCDDSDPNVNPGVPDDSTCDEIDDDCDGAIDEDTSILTVFPDADGDGFGAPSGGMTDCAVPSGFAANPNDCDDVDPDINPGEPETCNGIDDNCSGAADEGLLQSWYADDDGDGAGDFFDVTLACDAPLGTVSNPNDCDDADGQRFPGATELCDGIDQDCDIDIDEGLTDQPWFLDSDSDGFGDAAVEVVDCAPPPGYVDNDEDCDDTTTVINPGADEVCNQRDDDCDGDVDEGSPNASTWYLDADGDGRGSDADSVESCIPPSSDHVLDGGDCDDTNVSVAPGLLEVCDGVDNNCDGLADDDDPDVTMLPSWYADGDGDGVGDGPATQACVGPSGSVDTTGDCDDANSAIVPGADEVCDSIDNDCDGLVDDADTVDQGAVWYEDTDGDGVGGLTQNTTTCNGGPGLSLFSSDCDDTDPDVFPGAPEPCEGVDTNCDGVVEGIAVFVDADGDGLGDPASADWVCDGSGVVDGTDCDDTDATVNPDAVETPGDGVDQDCDGLDGVDTAEPLDTADTDDDPFVPTGDTAAQVPGTPVRPTPTGCGCASASLTQGFWAVVLLGGLPTRRRQGA